MLTAVSALEGMHGALVPDSGKKTPADKAKEAEILSAIPEEYREWLDRKLQNSHMPSLLDRILSLATRVGNIMPSTVGAPYEWARRVRDMRNAVAHASSYKGTDYYRKGFLILQSAQMLAEVLLLQEMGFSERDCEQIRNRDFTWSALRPRFRTEFPSWFSDSDID
jgi:hypothetical protein